VVPSGGAQTSDQGPPGEGPNPPPIRRSWSPLEERRGASPKYGEDPPQARGVAPGPFHEGAIRIWATRSLKSTDGYFAELEKFIKGYPDPDGHYTGYLSNIATLRKEIQADLGRAKSLDYLGVDSGR
jgi:hypothetical protein